MAAGTLTALAGTASANELPTGCTFDTGATTCVTDVKLDDRTVAVPGAKCIDGVLVYEAVSFLVPYERTTAVWQGRYTNDRQRLLSTSVETVYKAVVIPVRTGGAC